MKKTYIAPQMETYRIQTHQCLLDASNITPEQWTGGGSAGSRLFEDDGIGILIGGDLNDIQNLLLP